MVDFCFSSDDEKTFRINYVKSPCEINIYPGLKLKAKMSTHETVQLINSTSVNPYIITGKLPWHVVGTDSDSDLLTNRT